MLGLGLGEDLLDDYLLVVLLVVGVRRIIFGCCLAAALVKWKSVHVGTVNRFEGLGGIDER